MILLNILRYKYFINEISRMANIQKYDTTKQKKNPRRL